MYFLSPLKVSCGVFDHVFLQVGPCFVCTVHKHIWMYMAYTKLLIVFKQTPQGTFRGVDVNLKLNLKVRSLTCSVLFQIHVLQYKARTRK